MPLRVYAERDHYAKADRKALTDIIKALTSDASKEDKRKSYGRWVEQFELASSPDAADIHVLTMKWQHYVERGRVDQALSAVDVARKARKSIAVFSLGDFEANFPVPGRDIHIFQASAYRSRDATSNHAIPAFIEDPLAGLGREVNQREKGPRPIVGFCGQAGSSLPRHAARLVRNRIRRLRWRLGRELWEPTPIEHTWFRRRVLNTFAASDTVDSRFVLRTRYRAGVHSDSRNEPTDRARKEFLENVDETDYTICMRGGGNFSVRFYEALAMGRIPVFIDTDCLVPYPDRIDWKRYAVWVDEGSIADAPRVVSKFHEMLSPNEFRERQLECRRLWEERLTPDGFYRHFHEHFGELAS